MAPVTAKTLRTGLMRRWRTRQRSGWAPAHPAPPLCGCGSLRTGATWATMASSSSAPQAGVPQTPRSARAWPRHEDVARPPPDGSFWGESTSRRLRLIDLVVPMQRGRPAERGPASASAARQPPADGGVDCWFRPIGRQLEVPAGPRLDLAHRMHAHIVEVKGGAPVDGRGPRRRDEPDRGGGEKHRALNGRHGRPGLSVAPVCSPPD